MKTALENSQKLRCGINSAQSRAEDSCLPSIAWAVSWCPAVLRRLNITLISEASCSGCKNAVTAIIIQPIVKLQCLVWINTTATLFYRESSAGNLMCCLLQMKRVNYPIFITAIVVLFAQWKKFCLLLYKQWVNLIKRKKKSTSESRFFFFFHQPFWKRKKSRKAFLTTNWGKKKLNSYSGDSKAG